MIEVVKVSVDSDTDDSGSVPVQQINYLGRKGKAEVFFPYGMSANVPTGFLGLLFTILKQSSNRMVMFSSGRKRIKTKTGEVVFFHPVEGQYTHYRNDGSILTKTEKCTIVVQADGTYKLNNENGSVTLNEDGTVTIDSSQVTMTGNLQVDGSINADGAITSAVSVGAPTIAAATALTVAGTEMKEHTHLYTPGGGTPTQTGDPE